MERRKSTRFRVTCEVICTWIEELGVSSPTTGSVSDISAGGLFVNSSDRPCAGALAELQIKLPARGLRAEQIQLHGTARVVRLVENGTRSGFAMESAMASWAISRYRTAIAVNASK